MSPTLPFDLAAGWLQQHLGLPLLYRAGLMQWEEIGFGWTLFAVYGAVQVAVTYAVCLPLERFRPVERWPDRRAVGVDVLYTLIARVGLLPLVTFVLFYQVQVALTGWLTDHGIIPPTLEGFFPFLLGRPVLTFLFYVVILDFAEYWRHRLSLLVLLLRLIESLSHANTRLSFGWLGERLIVSPRFHRAHHGMTAAGQRSANYGAVLPWWDMLFGTADFSRRYVRTGDPTAEEALATGSYAAQQWAGLRRMLRTLAAAR
jgi:sterol desaturase/sphingolipid hydroxylase (fatty acid hydroxylase superfamily)